MSMLKKLVVALVVSGEFLAGSVKGEVWKTPWRVDKDGVIHRDGRPVFPIDAGSYDEYEGYDPITFDYILKYDLDDKGCYKGDDWDDADAIRGTIDNDTLQMAGFAYLMNNTTGESTPVFFGAKRLHVTGLPVNPSMLHTSVYDHTERQLVNACFSYLMDGDYGFLNIQRTTPNDKLPRKVNVDELKEKLGNGCYTLRVHTRLVPCGKYDAANSHASCAELYGHLLYILDGVDFNICVSSDDSSKVIPSYITGGYGYMQSKLRPEGPCYIGGEGKKKFVRKLLTKLDIDDLQGLNDEMKEKTYDIFLKGMVARAYMQDLSRNSISDDLDDLIIDRVLNSTGTTPKAPSCRTERIIDKLIGKVTLKLVA